MTSRRSDPSAPARPDAGRGRRAFLAGAGATAAAALLGACGSGKSATTTSVLKLHKGGSGDRQRYVLVPVFDSSSPYVAAGRPQRMVFALANGDGDILVDTGPKTLAFQMTDEAGRSVGAPISATLHDQDLQQGYYPVTFTAPAPGAYTAHTQVEGQPIKTAFQVFAADRVTMAGPGDAMPAVATPTVSDHRGVDPICTAKPQCPLHTVDLVDALHQPLPIALLIATPAYCQIGVCGPVLDVLVKHTKAYTGRVTFIHDEVYRSGAKAARGIRGSSNLSPLIRAMKLPFEPSLVLIKGGTIQARLDNVYDGKELTDALDQLLAA